MKVTKPLVATASLALVAGSCAVVGLSSLQATAQAEAQGAGIETESSNAQTASAIVGVSNVRGEFGYNQTNLTSNADIAKAFVGSNASACASMPDYDVVSSDPITVNGGDTSITATVDEMAEEDEAIRMVLACACASNTAGGGIIANADVSGVSLASIAQMVGISTR